MRILFSTAKLLLFLWVYHAGIAQNSRAPRAEGNIEYYIHLNDLNAKIAQVSLSFVPKDSLLYMTQGGDQLPDRWATYVHDLSVVNVFGETIPVADLTDAMWKLPSGINEKITVNYELHLDHAQGEWTGGLDGVVYQTDWGLFFTTRALLILHSDNWKEIKVHFSLPDSWRVSTPWEPINAAKTSFEVPNQSALMQSIFFAGTHRELSFKREGFELIFALGGTEILEDEKVYKELAGGILDYYIRLMGGLPDPPPDQKFDKSMVIINSAGQTDGEVIGNHISIMLEENGDPMAKLISRFIFAHEFFHLWNGKSLVPEDQSTEWFKEGFSNYYTLKALMQVGIFDEETYYQMLNNLFFQRYKTDDGLGTISMTQGEEKHDHWGIIYGGGLFVAIAQDMIIREASENSKSLDDLMRTMLKKLGGTHDHYTIDDLQMGLSELSGKDQSQFFSKYVWGKEQIPLSEYLSKAGLTSRVSEGQLIVEKEQNPTELQLEIREGLLGKFD